jgi:hypothetical protein
VFDEHGRFVTAILRPARRPKGTEIRAHLRRIVRQIRANRLDYVLGLAPTSTLRRHILDLEASTAARFAAGPGTAKVRRSKEFYDAAGSWNWTERIIARVEVGP